MRQALLSYRSIATFTLGISVFLIIGLLLRSNSLSILCVTSLVQITFYILSLYLLIRISSGVNRYEKIVLRILFVAIIFIILKDIMGDYLEIVLQQAQVFAITPSPFQKDVIRETYLSIRALDLLVYLSLLVFLFGFIKKFFWQKFVQLRAKIFFVFMFSLLLMLFNYSQPHKLDLSNFFSIYNYFSTMLKLTLFAIVMYILMHSKSRSLNLLSSGIIMLIAAQFVAYFYYAYNVLINIESLPDVTWFLSSMLTFLGFYHMWRNKDYTFENWFVETNSLEAQLAFRTLVIFCLSLILFFILAYTFELINGRKLLWLFLLVMGYCLIAVIASKHMARSFAKPFTQLQANMEKLIAETKVLKRPRPFELGEFNFLQNFIYDRFVERVEQSRKIENMAKTAIQVAHDIRSPAAAIMMLVKEGLNLPEEQRIFLRETASRVQDIANNLLTEYQESERNNSLSLVMIYPVISSLISEKRVQYRDRLVSFVIEAEALYFAHIRVNGQEFRRLLSNLINNSIEATSINNKSNIVIRLSLDNGFICLSITDNGPGIPKEVLKKLQMGKMHSTKPGGFGLGLKQAREFMIKHQGKFKIESELGLGTTIHLQFELGATPCWLAESIVFFPEGQIIVLDDEVTIHTAWAKRFSSWIKRYPKLKINYFHNANHCMQYINDLSVDERKSLLLLSDYELYGQEVTGLDLIESLQVGKSILVTSYYDQLEIVKRAILGNVKILPKTLASEITFLPLDRESPAYLGSSIDLILLDDKQELTNVIHFLAKNKNKNLAIFSNPIDLFENIVAYPKSLPICLDYDLNLPVTGIEVAARLHTLGFTKLYLSSGFALEQSKLPEYLKILPDKMSILTLLKD